jgi:hypothetical protein
VQANGPTAQRLQEVLTLLRNHVEQHYRIPVLFIDVPDPFVGDLDGEEIWIDNLQTLEIMLFNLIHLFGHTVQWNLLGQASEIGNKAPGEYTEADLSEVARYERDASCYGLELLHDLGIHDLDAWLTSFSASDVAYLIHYYKTGQKVHPQEMESSGEGLLAPLRIPAFSPKRLKLRSTGVVI